MSCVCWPEGCWAGGPSGLTLALVVAFGLTETLLALAHHLGYLSVDCVCRLRVKQKRVTHANTRQEQTHKHTTRATQTATPRTTSPHLTTIESSAATVRVNTETLSPSRRKPPLLTSSPALTPPPLLLACRVFACVCRVCRVCLDLRCVEQVALFVSFGLTETLSPSRRKPLTLQRVDPFVFLGLFRRGPLARRFSLIYVLQVTSVSLYIYI